MARYLLGIDNGSTMSKAALFRDDGGEVAVASRKVELLSPHAGWSERDPLLMWDETAAAIREVLAESGVGPDEIVCVACTGFGNGLFLVDEHGNPVRNAINSTDSRAQSYVDRWLADGVDAAALPLTTQCVWAAQPGALLGWVRDNEPDVMARAHRVLMCKDYVRLRLTGTAQGELTDMSGSGLMNVVTGEYDQRVLDLFGIGDLAGLLPPLVQTADICGAITPAAASETGLNAGTPVAGGMFDIDACGLASGIVDERQMSLVAGTWGNNQYIAREPLIDKGLFMTSRYSMPGWFLMLEGSPTSASNLEWFVTEFMAAEREAVRKTGGTVYGLCNDMVAGVDPRDLDIVFLPFLYGSNANGAAKSCFIGLEGRHTRAHVLRAVYEGIVFGHNTHLQRLLQFRSAPEVIRFTGGAARSEVWVQMFADCFQIPVEIPAGTELGALGAAIAAAVACGLYADYPQAVAAMTRIARRQDPDAAAAAMYAAKFERHQAVQTALDSYWVSSVE